MSIRCALIVDLASVEYRIGKEQGSASPLDLSALVDLFEGYGLEPVELSVAGPFVPVVGGLRGNPDVARRLAGNANDWWIRQLDRLATLRPELGVHQLLGGTNGQREVAVDLAAAAGALDAVRRTNEAKLDLVVLCSHDADFYHLYKYSNAAPLVLAGAFSADERHWLNRGVTPSIQIPPEDLSGLAEAGGTAARRDRTTGSLQVGARQDHHSMDRSIVGVMTGDQVLIDSTGQVRSSPLNRRTTTMRRARAALQMCSTIAVVDPYGMFNATIRSIGVARLPGAESVRDTLAALGWDSPMAVLATVPDLRDDRLANLPERLVDAWLERDGQLDALAGELLGDDDPTTSATRAVIKVKDDHCDDPDRDLAARAIKRLATGLLADLWLAVTTVPDAAHVLVSEDPDLVAALELLALSAIDTYRDVVRVGVHAGRRRLELELHSEPDLPHFVLLDDVRLAELTRVSGRPFGGRHRRLLNAALEHGHEVKAVGLDPETGAEAITLLVRFDEDDDGVDEEHHVESLLYGLREGDARPKPSHVLPDGHGDRQLLLTFDRVNRCSHPVVRYRHSKEVVRVEAVVVDQDGSWITVDIDHDGLADERVPIGHEALDFDPDCSVLLVREADGQWNLADPVDAMLDDTELEVVTVTAQSDFTSTRTYACLVRAVEDGVTGPLVVGSGRAAVEADEGQFLFALRHDGAAGTYFVSMSSPMKHLGQMLGERR